MLSQLVRFTSVNSTPTRYSATVLSVYSGFGPLYAMHLYNLTLQPPTAITQAVVGNFSGARQQEIIVSRGTRLELLRPDVQTGKVSTVIASDVFGSIRSLAAFRLTGGTKGELPYVSIFSLRDSHALLSQTMPS